MKITRALISVSDKTGIASFARALERQGIDIISTGGTAELLRTGRYNVTEAATEVGYSSLSHFSKAFCETIGCCPVLYPAAKNVILDR